MKKIILTIMMSLIALAIFAQSETGIAKESQERDVIDIYELFPTQNIWTFIKLNTRNGKMWQVQFSLEETSERTEVYINSLALVYSEEQVNGRFTLVPTQNMYNFILLDQIDGSLWQVQWSTDPAYRGILPIN